MNKNNVYCEPFCIQKGYDFEIHHVVYSEDSPYSCFMHFHEVHELIVFDSIDGTFFYSQGKSTLEDRDLVFTPALETHDFELSSRIKSWYIIQFLPSVLLSAGLAQADGFFKSGMHLRLSPEDSAAIQTLARWLLESYQCSPSSDRSGALLRTILSWVAERAEPVKPPHYDVILKSSGYLKLEPVINLFRHNQCVNLSLEQAAALCCLSPAYFSRLFKSVFRCNYSDYNVKHRLYSAARLLSQSQFSITDISYELNFSSPSHFIAQFKKQFGVTPKKYKTSVIQGVG
ncbi:AraC family transcriptional regulator [Cellvibrio sp. BR]|uniref:AraC family transcriptional regulator n=1 Tax=Cellvibrio sp. BR TaxID=1134474 RepID=UPI000260157C|nr:AraC family transcriptional regulator [Cellvibrio sp. BR]EIK45868.1 AraC family transcriptional regulator [Cellvibrio sp. BR]